jgi:hypothetical protein
VCRYILEDEQHSNKRSLVHLEQNISIVKSIFRKLLGHYQKKQDPAILKAIKKNFEKNRKKLEPMLKTHTFQWTMPKIERLLFKYVGLLLTLGVQPGLNKKEHYQELLRTRVLLVEIVQREPEHRRIAFRRHLLHSTAQEDGGSTERPTVG